VWCTQAPGVRWEVGVVALELEPCLVHAGSGELLARGFVREHDGTSLVVEAKTFTGMWLQPGDPAVVQVLSADRGSMTYDAVVAFSAARRIGLSNLVAIGLAKKEELVFTRDSDQPLALDPHGPALRLLQRIRDEAHRFAVTFHRRARAMRDLRSELDDVPGVGPRRRRSLLTHFGSLASVRRATIEELTAVVGARAAAAVVEHFAHA